ncbi:hypothetical protein [Clostridium sp. YIM B02569]|uniref:hypothetical protein n=1 Tax=Clostridium sp. YIM B02569 TaxID=2911967 RepID=UPI001EEBF295|nr:hypothetical protein [Clostridium sp. YIM B02569]
MEAFNLAWTKYGPLEDETSVLDPLAFDYFAQILGNVVLPSFTTRTSRARYYSMVCYGIYISKKYLQLEGKPYYEKDVLEVFKLYEKYWARAVVENYQGNLFERDGKERDFRGKRGALKSYEKNITTLGLEYKFLSRQLELGGLGAYRTSLEALLLVDASLNLTHKGEMLAKAFVDTAIYDKLVLKAIRDQSIVMKEGRGSVKSFGYHASLDGFINFDEYHEEEMGLLKDYILNDAKSIIPVSYIYHNYDYENSNIMETIKDISNSNGKTDEETYIIQGYKTILAFERLAIVFNRLWCNIIKAAEEQFGSITIDECVQASKEILDDIFENNYIGNLVTRQNYSSVSGSYHGGSFNIFISKYSKGENVNYESFIMDLIKYHIKVMEKRRSGAWVAIDGNKIIVLTGYDYPKKTEKLAYLHSYKIPNIITLINDLRWEPNDEVH